MGKEKGGFLTPKAIANRIKAKGLQKLRWYCQMCQKQCRDENGFKCHLMSESHQRQLLLFAENPDQYIDTFSEEFLETFLELLRRRFGTKRVQANQVYQEYISDRNHTHMNSTQWETLTDFVKWLGREGHCTVDETEKGWFIQYISRDPETIKRQEAVQKKEKMDLDDEEKMAKFIEKQIGRAAAAEKEKKTVEYTELQRKSEEEKLTLNIALKKTEKPKILQAPLPLNSLIESKPSTSETKKPQATVVGVKRKSALDDIILEEEIKKEKKNRKDYWLFPGILVKVITKKLGDKYYKKKGVIKEVIDKYLAVVKMIDTGVKLKVDQEHLETVIPAIGKNVLVVNGAYRGTEAVLQAINEKAFSCTVKLTSGLSSGRIVQGVQYEDVSKLSSDR